MSSTKPIALDCFFRLERALVKPDASTCIVNLKRATVFTECVPPAMRFVNVPTHHVFNSFHSFPPLHYATLAFVSASNSPYRSRVHGSGGQWVYYARLFVFSDGGPFRRSTVVRNYNVLTASVPLRVVVSYVSIKPRIAIIPREHSNLEVPYRLTWIVCPFIYSHEFPFR